MTHDTHHTDTQGEQHRTPRVASNPTTDDADVYVVTTDQRTPAEAVTLLDCQKTVSPLDPAHCCDGGDHGFRIYKTSLPIIRNTDIRSGIFLYRPTPNPTTVYEVQSHIYDNPRGWQCIDVRAHSAPGPESPSPESRTHTTSLFAADVLDTMTFLQPETVQQTITPSHAP
jgi:hypothetical protein